MKSPLYRIVILRSNYGGEGSQHTTIEAGTLKALVEIAEMDGVDEIHVTRRPGIFQQEGAQQ